jgi:hypothetical protein
VSDAAIQTIVNGLITVVTMVLGFIPIYLKLKQSATKAEEAATNAKLVEHKIDANTVLTEKIDEQTNGGLDRKLSQISDHAARIADLEGKIVGVEGKVDSLGKNLDSTRHEFRGHFGTITNALNSLTIMNSRQPPKES